VKAQDQGQVLKNNQVPMPRTTCLAAIAMVKINAQS